MKKKYRVTKKAKKLFFGLIIISVLIFSGVKIYNNVIYKRTYTYKILQLGYSESETKKIVKNYNNKNLNYILSIPKNDVFTTIYKEKYFKESKLKDYMSLITDGDKIKDAIIKINTFTNYEFYSHDVPMKSYDNNMIVNKYYKLEKEYIPEDLVAFSSDYAWGEYGYNKATKETVDAFMAMKDKALQSNINLMVNSSYRSYEEQEEIYNSYVEEMDVEYANKYAAKPGYSEHQSGLALDIFSTKDRSQKTFADGETYAWLKEHCYEFGFILRYPLNKENITGYDFESWHYRYVGKEIAKYIKENDITYDEYYGYFIEK